MSSQPPFRQVRARFDERTVTVYQAYPPEIAGPAVAAQHFVAPFKPARMTWIKPSFLWMMYRCGWATKPGQERVLAIGIGREHFERALRDACLSHFDAAYHASHEAWQEQLASSPNRIQWDPERTPDGAPLPWRSLQLGLGARVAPDYATTWISRITDITDELPRLRQPDELRALLEQERPYPVPEDVQRRIGMV